MVLYQCPRCHYKSSKKPHMRDHYKRKKICEPLFSDVYLVEFIKIEKNKNSDESEIERLRRELDEKNKQIGELIQRVGNNNNNHIDNSQNINITINAYKDTDYTVLENMIEKCYKIKQGEEELDMKRVIKHVHCNKEYPENHNIYITDKSRKKCMAFDGNKWVQVGEGVPGIETILKNTQKGIHKQTKIDHVGDTLLDYNSEDTKESKRKEIRDSISNTLSNGKKLVLETHNI